MNPTKTAAQVLSDSMTEAEWADSFEDHVTGLGGRFMHARPSRVRGDRHATATSCPWPDYSIWFPDAFTEAARLECGVHLVELKTNRGQLSKGRIVNGVRRDGQAEVFDSLEQAGATVRIWRPRDLDAIVLPTLRRWAGRTP